MMNDECVTSNDVYNVMTCNTRIHIKNRNLSLRVSVLCERSNPVFPNLIDNK